MDYILDTHTLLWTLFNPSKLPENIIKIISNENNGIYYSAASLWEIELKHVKKPQMMEKSAKEIYEIIMQFTDFVCLPVGAEEIMKLGILMDEKIHEDPYDHIIMSTALWNDMTLITHDEMISKYRNLNIIYF